MAKAKKIKLKVVTEFIDKKTDEVRKVGDTFEATEKRFEEIKATENEHGMQYVMEVADEAKADEAKAKGEKKEGK